MTRRVHKFRSLKISLIFVAVPLVVSFVAIFAYTLQISQAQAFTAKQHLLEQAIDLSQSISATCTSRDQVQTLVIGLNQMNSLQSHATIKWDKTNSISPSSSLARKAPAFQALQAEPTSTYMNGQMVISQPFHLENGTDSGTLLLQLNPEELLGVSGALKTNAINSILIAIILSIVGGLSLATVMIRQGSKNPAIRSISGALARSKFRYIELGLAAIFAIILLISSLSISMIRTLSSQGDALEYQSKNVLKVLSDAEAITFFNKSLPQAQLLADTSQANLASLLPELTSDSFKDKAKVILAANTKFNEIDAKQNLINEQEHAEYNRTEFIFIFAALMALSTLLLWKSSLNRQKELAISATEAQNLSSKYKELSNNLPIGLYLYKSGQLESYNESWAELMKRSKDQPHEADWWLGIHEEDRSKVLSSLVHAEDTKSPFEIQFRISEEDGESRHLLTRVTPVLNSDQSLRYLLGFVLDETARVRAEKEIVENQILLKEANEALTKSIYKLQDAMESVLHSLVRAVEAKDPYIAGHSERVMMYSVRLGESIGLSGNDLRLLEVGGLVHDVGKIGIPDNILLKPGRLTPDEYEIIKRHPDIGAKMLSCISTFADCQPIIRYHHERLDGSGYPCGLKGNEIPLLVQICAIADEFDAMTSARAYRSEMTVAKALGIMRGESEEGKLNSDLLEVFARIVLKEGALWKPMQGFIEDIPA